MDLSADNVGSVSISVTGDGPLELFFKGENVVSNKEHMQHDAISFYVNPKDGHLYAVVPDDLDKSCVWVDEQTGHLFVKI